ncbi:inorganic phosphate transporter [Gottfriedia solisilvae]|uniref:Putative low-affinity inorganic phosphate transporter n=1 Tax=Gottfriedia solisilvae TaxID=1516104 RepID=A0A8J3AQZ8_9BACI|nr:inorganic phosphate transporter [Gottfriedia solisilvae]GGI14733.1 putative low-affinity inorganic phosphate transporter [Gottfriedia solisilvae]
MEHLFLLTVLVVIFALAFDFINGFHDTANAIATSVSTKALKPRTAILLAAGMNFLGAIIFTGVAKTITTGIVDPVTIEGTNGLVVVIAALLGGIFWNLLTWYYGIPSSSSHAIIGAVAGAAISAKGFHALEAEGFIKIIQALLISPVIAITVGFIVMTILAMIFKRANLSKTNKGFRIVQIFTAALQSFTHGTNDAQKAMGIIMIALIASNEVAPGSDVPLWVRIACATAMALGTSIGGWKIIKTVGGKIMKIRPINGAAADLSSAAIIFTFTALHLPVSTTHVISSSIMGVGSAQRVKDVNWGTAKRMVITWVITIPISATVAAIFYQILNIFF